MKPYALRLPKNPSTEDVLRELDSFIEAHLREIQTTLLAAGTDIDGIDWFIEKERRDWTTTRRPKLERQIREALEVDSTERQRLQ